MTSDTTSAVRAQWTAARPDLDTASMDVIGPVKRIEALLTLALEPLYESAPITPAEMELLIHLRHLAEPVIARRLAEWAHRSPAAVSKTLGKLERRGLVARRSSETDRRASLVTITEAGSAAIDEVFPKQLAVEDRLLAGLGPDRERVVAALELLTEVMERAAGRST